VRAAKVTRQKAMANYCLVYGVIHFVTCGLTACTPGSAPGPANYCLVYGVIHFVTCGLTACTPGSAPGPTLGKEYGKTSPFYRVLSGLRRSGRRDLERRVSGCALVCISSRYYQSTDNSTQSRSAARLDEASRGAARKTNRTAPPSVTTRHSPP